MIFKLLTDAKASTSYCLLRLALVMPSNAAERVFDQAYSTPIPILYCIIPVYAATQPDYMINSQKAKGSDYVTRMSACTCGPVIYFPYSHCFATPTEVCKPHV